MIKNKSKLILISLFLTLFSLNMSAYADNENVKGKKIERNNISQNKTFKDNASENNISEEKKEKDIFSLSEEKRCFDGLIDYDNSFLEKINKIDDIYSIVNQIDKSIKKKTEQKPSLKFLINVYLFNKINTSNYFSENIVDMTRNILFTLLLEKNLSNKNDFTNLIIKGESSFCQLLSNNN